MFKNRIEAGKKLAQKIKEKFPKIKDAIILALPRGGVVIGLEVAKELKFPLDIIVTRKIGAPENSEYAVAAVSENEIVLNPREDIDKDYISEQSVLERQEISRRQKEYRGDSKTIDLKNKMVILVDDGLATGLTMEVAIKEVKRQNPAKIIVAVPIAPPQTFENLKPKIDNIIVLEIEPMFFAVGQFYKEFGQVTDNEVREILGISNKA